MGARACCITEFSDSAVLGDAEEGRGIGARKRPQALAIQAEIPFRTSHEAVVGRASRKTGRGPEDVPSADPRSAGDTAGAAVVGSEQVVAPVLAGGPMGARGDLAIRGNALDTLRAAAGAHCAGVGEAFVP